MCDDNIEDSVAEVVCRQLGLSTHGEALMLYNLLKTEHNISDPKVVFQFGGGKRRSIFLHDIVCNGNEMNLLQCTHDGIEDHNCDHFEDAGVSCGKSLKHSVSTYYNVFSNTHYYSPTLQ